MKSNVTICKYCGRAFTACPFRLNGFDYCSELCALLHEHEVDKKHKHRIQPKVVGILVDEVNNAKANPDAFRDCLIRTLVKKFGCSYRFVGTVFHLDDKTVKAKVKGA